MMKKSNDDWYLTPNRQAPVAILMIIYKIILSIVRNWWPFILIIIFRSNFITPDDAKLLAIVVASLVILFSIWSYFRFYFFIKDKKLHVHKGVFNRTKLDIPFDRIQSVSFEKNIIHQIFHVARLKIDTAGSAKEEFEFTALDLERAEELRSFIMRHRETSIVEAKDEAFVRQDATLLIHHGVSDLIKVGVSQNHLRTVGIILAFFIGLRDRIRESFGDRYVDQIDTYAEYIFENTLVYGLGLFIILLIISFLGTLLITVLRYFDLRLWKTSDGYKLVSGLFNRREQVVGDQKIQIIRWVSNPIRKMFKIVLFRFYQASSAMGTRRTSITVPGIYTSHLDSIVKSFLDGLHDFGPSHSIHRSYFYRRALYIAFIPALALLGIFLLTFNQRWLIISVLWMVIVTVFQHYQQKKWHFYFTPYCIQTASGVFERVHKAILLYKIQGATIRQSPYQRRKALATIILHTASGDVKIPYLDSKQAMQIKNYILYRAEVSKARWM